MPRGGGGSGGRGGGGRGGSGRGGGGGRGGWGGGRGGWGHGGGWGRRRGWWGYGYPYLSYDYPTTYYVDREADPEYIDCVHATGKCPEELKREFGESVVKDPSDRCKERRVQDFVQNLPAKCRPENYDVSDDDKVWVGVL